MSTIENRLRIRYATRWYFKIESKLSIQMKDGTRLTLDILISAAFAVVAAIAGLLVGLIVSLIVFFLFFRGSDAIGQGLIMVFIVGFCGLVGGFFGFPLCAIWLDARRKTLMAEQSASPSQNPRPAG